MKVSRVANDNLIDQTIAVWQPRQRRQISREEARQITETSPGSFPSFTSCLAVKLLLPRMITNSRRLMKRSRMTAEHARVIDPFAGAAPHNIEAEQCLLGAIFNNNRVFIQIESLVDAEDFFEPIHQEIFEICSRLVNDGKVASPITVKTFLSAVDVEGLTRNQYLARLCAEATTIINAVDYAAIIRDLADRRRLIATAEKMIEAAKTATVDVSAKELTAKAASAINEIAKDRRSFGGSTPILGPLNAADFLKLELPPRRKIVAPWLPEKGLVMIYSLRGVGKTLLGMTSAYAIAAGADFLGFRTEKPRRAARLNYCRHHAPATSR
jgi:DnaB-like helicase N terminal domain/AAA domain